MDPLLLPSYLFAATCFGIVWVGHYAFLVEENMPLELTQHQLAYHLLLAFLLYVAICMMWPILLTARLAMRPEE